MSGPALVVLHHFGGSARSWCAVSRALGGAHRLVVPDLAGFGASRHDPGPFGVGDQADRVAAAIAHAGLRDFVLVGHSMGGKIALALAARRPAELRALLLLAPSPPTPEPIDEVDRELMLAAWADPAACAAMLDRATARPLVGDARERAIDDMLRSGERAWRAWVEEGSREDISADMARIEVPVTILSGVEDRAIPTAIVRDEVAARLPGGLLLTVLRMGHLLPVEHPSLVAGAIGRVVADIALPPQKEQAA